MGTCSHHSHPAIKYADWAQRLRKMRAVRAEADLNYTHATPARKRFPDPSAVQTFHIPRRRLEHASRNLDGRAQPAGRLGSVARDGSTAFR